MRVVLASWLALAVLLAPQPASRAAGSETVRPDAAGQGPQTGAAQRSPDLEEIVEKAYLAYGGRESLARFESNCLMSGKRTAFKDENASTGRFRQWTKGAKLRIELDENGAEAAAATVFDGVTAWRADGRHDSDLPADQARILGRESFRQPWVLTRMGQPGYVFSLVGRTTYKHVPVYVVEVAAGDASPTVAYIDQKNYLVVAITYAERAAGGKPVTVSNEYSEYRPLSGTMVPFRQSQFVSGSKVVDLSLESVDFDSPIDDRLFARAPGPEPPRLARPEPVPFEYLQGELVVKVRLNGGEPVDFLLDTGATETIVDRRVAAEHYLDKESVREIAAAGGKMAMPSSKARRLEIGAVSLADVPVLLVDLTPQSRQLGRKVYGIIGSNVLDDFTVSIDYARQQALISDPAAFRARPEAAAVPFAEPGIPVVTARLNDREEERFLVDTGAAFNHMPHAAARKFVSGQPQYTSDGTGLDGRPVKLGTVSVESVEVGGQKVRKVSFTYPAADDPLISQRGGFFQGRNIGVLGNPFWQNFVLTLDYKRSRVYLLANPEMRARQEGQHLVTSGDAQLIMHRDYRSALDSYQKALSMAQTARDVKAQARALGRLGNLYRVMARDLRRPEHAKVAYDYFVKAQAAARQARDGEGEGRILADWSLLYSDRGQSVEAKRTIDSAFLLAPHDPQVNVDYAVQLFRASMYPDMQRYVEKALFLDPSNWQALWYQVKLAEIYRDNAKLTSTLKEILRFYPWSKLAREKLAGLAAAPAAPAGKTAGGSR